MPLKTFIYLMFLWLVLMMSIHSCQLQMRVDNLERTIRSEGSMTRDALRTTAERPEK